MCWEAVKACNTNKSSNLKGRKVMRREHILEEFCNLGKNEVDIQ